MEALATVQEETSDSESEASSSNCSDELLNLEVNQLMYDVLGDSENEGNEELHSMEVTEDSRVSNKKSNFSDFSLQMLS